ncbi:tyrosine-type recombinase/integrase [Inconstantimicrobium mannanitabidum]|uniref:Uncharacterized protein n=1 Tax=Inconstantimicrobium mannanitabidum TaxID=1604901 RepID=A0ACB5R9D7_9CLOT|nr:tyrosine-type recombinase/integrase [Clostridium sp. TW13]GKX65804.1 hypothetical protein rsdtw13_10620 [Clostridium sp. TW13]
MLKKINMKTKGTNKTFDDGFEQFILEHCVMKNLRPSTEKHYREITKYSFYKFYDKDTELQNLQQEDINNYVLWLKERDIKESTINIQLKALKTVIKFFKDKGWIDDCIKVALIKADIEEIEAYTDEEISKLLVKPNLKKCTFVEYRNWVCVCFLCNTGCRRSTLINIQLEDLNVENGYCHYRHTKNRKAQTVPISPSMCNIIKEYLEYLPQECIYLFPTVLGEQMKARSISHALDDYNHSRNIQRTGIHKFRHWFCKKSVLLGMDLIRLQKIVGHSNLEVLRNYVNLLTQDLKKDEVIFNPLEDIQRKNKETKHIKLKK